MSAVAKQRSKGTSGAASASVRVGYALVGLAVAVAAVGGVFPHGAQFVIAVILVWAGMTLVGRALAGSSDARDPRLLARRGREFVR